VSREETMKNIKVVKCNREFGLIHLVCHTDESYDALIELFNDGKNEVD